MKLFHTADWHLGKLVQGIHMTEDQDIVLQQLIAAIAKEKPDAVIIAGDLYDRSIPPTEAVQLLNDTLNTIVLDLKVPVLAIAGNHDSPSRLDFASQMMRENDLYLVGQYDKDAAPVVLNDAHGPVYFHLIPYCDPSLIRDQFQDDEIRTHQDAAAAIVKQIKEKHKAIQDQRHVYIGHAFITASGEKEENTSESELPLAIGGAEHVKASLYKDFSYTALGHLHQAHQVSANHIRYAGSILKYSISEENHKKGYFIVELNETGQVSVEKKLFIAERDMRTVEAYMADILQMEPSDDYIFIKLLDEAAILSPMEKVRSIFPNAMHIERKALQMNQLIEKKDTKPRHQLTDMELFEAFYQEVVGKKPSPSSEAIFAEAFDTLLKTESERK